MAHLLPSPKMQFFDDNGDPLNGGKIYTYEATTATPKATYTTAAEAVANANPVVLNSRGEANIFWSTGAYKIIVKTSADVEVYTVDSITLSASGAAGSSFRVGSGVPSDSLGANGDVYLRSSNGALYVKDAGVYTTSISLSLPASAIVNTPSGNLAAVTVQNALNELQGDIDTGATNLANHLADGTDAHAGSAITNTPSGNLAATTVQAALNELQTDVDTRATSTALSDHLNDAADAHDASAISSVPSGNLAADDVQEALNELQTDIDSRATSTALTNHTGDTADAHDASAISFDNVASGMTATDVQAAIEELAGGTGGGGGAGLEWYFGDSNAPGEVTLSNGLRILEFYQSPDENEMFCELVVPSSYVAGTQIFLTDGKFFAAETSGNVLLSASTVIFKANVDATSSPTAHASTNAQQGVDATTNEIVEMSDVDLTNASGQINAVAVAAGDTLLVKFFRDTSAETSALAGTAKLLRGSLQPKFTA